MKENSISKKLKNSFESVDHFCISCGIMKFGDDERYCLYNKNIEYIGQFEPLFDRKNNLSGYFKVYIEPNPVIVNGCKSVISTMNEYNSTLTIPAFCNDPWMVPMYRVIKAFRWYTRKVLGYSDVDWFETSFGVDDTCVLKTIYGNVISRINLSMDKSDTEMKGRIWSSCGSGSWVECKFDGIEDMINSINSIIGPDLLITATNAVNMSNNMVGEMGKDVSHVGIDNSLNVYKKNITNSLKNSLKKALESLEKSEE